MAKAKKYKKEERSSVTKIQVLDEVCSWITQEDDGQMYGNRECTAQEHSVQGIVVLEQKDYSDLEVNFEVKFDKTYYLVYGVYDTGDSFGHDEGRIHLVDLYQKKEAAEKTAQTLRAHYDKYKSGDRSYDSPTLKLESGEKMKHHVPWCGYFESLQFIEVKPVHRVDKSTRW